MMNIEFQWILYLLLASNTLLAGGAALAILRAERMTRQQASFWKSPTGAAISMQPRQDEFLQDIERRVEQIAELVAVPRTAGEGDHSSANVLPFENAVRMAQHGATLDDLTRTCGLSANEARLLMRVHGQKSQVAAAG